MPFLHRLACFRDDVVFLVFLYQVGLRFLCLGFSPGVLNLSGSVGYTGLIPSE